MVFHLVVGGVKSLAQLRFSKVLISKFDKVWSRKSAAETVDWNKTPVVQ